MIRANMYAYSQRFGPSSTGAGSHAGLPILWSLYTIVSIATITPLLHRDDSGCVGDDDGRREAPGLQRRPATHEPAERAVGRAADRRPASAVLAAVYMVLIGRGGWSA